MYRRRSGFGFILNNNRLARLVTDRGFCLSLVSLLLLVLVTVNLWGAEGALTIVFQGKNVENIEAGQDQGGVYLPLNFFSDVLGFAVAQDEESGEIQLQVGTVTVMLKEAAREVLWGKEAIRLSTPPRKVEGLFWLPLEIVTRMGLQVQKHPDRLVVDWTENYLLSVDLVTHQGRPAYLFRTAQALTDYNSFLLEQPARLVVDLDGVVPYPEMEYEPGESEIVQAIRTSRFDGDKMRVVFDLSSLTGYRIESSVEEPTRLMVVFNSVLEKVEYVSAVQEPMVFIEASYPVQYRTTLAFNPHRVIIDLWDVTLQGKAFTIPGGGDWIERIRVSQFNPYTIRVVLDVKEPRGCVVAPSRKTPNRLEIKTIQRITDLTWREDNGGELWLRSTGEIEEETVYDQDRKVFVLLLKHAVLDEKVHRKKEEFPLAIQEEEVSTVRIEIPMTFALKHNLKFSADHKELQVNFTVAPLHQRLIVLDPGHGGVDSGAIGGQGVREKEVNLAVAHKLRRLLEAAGAHVIMTRTDDRYVALYERAAIANRASSILTLSIHSNFHPDPKVNGFEVFHHPDRKDSALLGQALFEQVLKETQLKPLAVKTSKDLVLTRETQMATVLIEMGFLSNFQEEARLNSDDFQNKMAKGIFQGVINYFQNKE